jgi:RNA polymerase sigma factor (sigma-70 family)
MPVASREKAVFRFIRDLAVREQSARLPDHELLRRFAKTRQREAFAALVRRHGPMVYRVCLQILENEHDAEDAFQATFLVLSRKAASVKKRDSVGSWLFGVANHAATNQKRSRARRRSHESQAGQASVIDPLSAVTLREGQAILNEELSRLPEKYRAPLVLCSLEGSTRDETARQLGLPLGTLKSRLEQARKLLRARLVARGLTVAGAFVASVFGEQMAAATIPTVLLNSTVQAAAAVAAGSPAASCISAHVAALTEGVLRAMLVSKLKTAAVMLAMAMLLTTGLGTFAYGRLGAAPSARDKGGGEEPAAGSASKPGELHSFPGHSDAVPAVAVAQGPDGLLAISAGRSESAVRVWDLKTNQQLRTFDGHTSWVWSVALTKDGKRALSGGVDGARFWEVATGKELHHFTSHERQVYRVALSADGRRALSGSQDHTVRLWELENGTELQVFSGHADAVSSVAFSPDGKQVLSCSVDHIMLLWDPESGKELRRLAGGSIALFSPDGRTIISGGRLKYLQLWDVKTGKELHRLEGHTDEVGCLAFSADGKRVLSGGNDNTIRLWEVATAKELCCFTGHTDSVSGLGFTPDAGRALSGSYDQTMRLWQLPK